MTDVYMVGESLATFLRSGLMVGALLVCAVLIVQGFLGRKGMSWGEKALVGGVVGILVYVADALRASLENGLTWDARLLPLSVGLALIVGFLLEPVASRRRWRTERTVRRAAEQQKRIARDRRRAQHSTGSSTPVD